MNAEFLESYIVVEYDGSGYVTNKRRKGLDEIAFIGAVVVDSTEHAAYPVESASLSSGRIVVKAGPFSLSYTPESGLMTAIKNDGGDVTPTANVFTQWRGKTWYAYGTSITNIDGEGVYPRYLAQMSGMTVVNRGVSGGGIGDLGAYSQGQVYEAICNLADGKQNADLITLETGANDYADLDGISDVPLGTVYDTGRSTLAGCLTDCLRYLQANTDAQIVVFPSPIETHTQPIAANAKMHEWYKLMEEICYLNRVPFLKSSNNMGWGKLTSEKGSRYLIDHVHHSELGGYIYAQTIWYQLRNVPVFSSSVIPDPEPEPTPDPEPTPETWETVFDGTLDVEDRYGYNVSVIDNYPDTPAEGDVYRVTFNGTSYECVAYIVSDVVVVGNSNWGGASESGNDEPFALMANAGEGKMNVVSNATPGETITLVVEKQM